MLDQTVIQELFEKFYHNLPEGIKNNFNLAPFKQDLSKTFKLILEQSFSKLDLVTREQFDIQNKVLAATREQLTILTKKVADLEKISEGK